MPLRENQPDFNDASDDFKAVLNAALAGDKPYLEQWTASGKSLDLVDAFGRSVVLAATMLNDMAALMLLIELGADVDHYDPALSSDVIDPTAFLYAGAHGMNETLSLLIEAGARPDIYNYYGGNALIPAAEKGHLDTVKLLLETSDVDVNHINRLGWTALMEAVVLTDGGPVHQRIIELLLAHGADATIADKDGVSALEHAEHQGFVEIAELLRSTESKK